MVFTKIKPPLKSAGYSGAGDFTTNILSNCDDGIISKEKARASASELGTALLLIQSSIPLEIRKQTNFDHPDAFDWPLFEQQIAELRKGHPIEQPTYSYIICTRLPETVHVEPKEVIIVEGIMSLYDKELRDLMDLKIFVDAEPDERLLRVITRDMVERGHPLEMLIDKYRNILKPMHDEFIEPTKQYADIIIPNGGNNQKAIEILKLYIEKILGR